MKNKLLFLCGLLLAVSSALSAQFRSLGPHTGSGNDELYKLAPGYKLTQDLNWDRGEFQDLWATSSLAAEGKPPTPPYPKPVEPEDEMENEIVYAEWSEMYAPSRLSDQDITTPWVEGAQGSGVGEIVMLPFSGTKLRIWNGFQKSQRLFERNGRVKAVRVYILSAQLVATQFGEVYQDITVLAQKDLVLSDTQGEQDHNLPAYKLPVSNDDRFYYRPLIALKILSVYPGSAYTDTCISELYGID